jgi:hypothetical protein
MKYIYTGHFLKSNLHTSVKLMYSEKATKFEEISLIVLRLLKFSLSEKAKKEDGANFCGLLRKAEL